MRLTTGERIAAGIVCGELGVLTWCVWAVVRVYRSVKGKTG
jgi:hypothetical protein